MGKKRTDLSLRILPSVPSAHGVEKRTLTDQSCAAHKSLQRPGGGSVHTAVLPRPSELGPCSRAAYPGKVPVSKGLLVPGR